MLEVDNLLNQFVLTKSFILADAKIDQKTPGCSVFLGKIRVLEKFGVVISRLAFLVRLIIRYIFDFQN